VLGIVPICSATVAAKPTCEDQSVNFQAILLAITAKKIRACSKNHISTAKSANCRRWRSGCTPSAAHSLCGGLVSGKRCRFGLSRQLGPSFR
jgi:hypothetical protein